MNTISTASSLDTDWQYLFLGVPVFVKVALRDVQVGADGFEVKLEFLKTIGTTCQLRNAVQWTSMLTQYYLSAKVARTEDMLYLARNEQSFEFSWQINCAMRNVEIAYAQNQHHCLYSCKAIMALWS